MGLGASVSAKNKAEPAQTKHLDVEAIKGLKTEIRRLEDASHSNKELDEYIDGTQIYSNTSTISSTPAVTLVTDSVHKTVSNLGNYLDNIDNHLEMTRTKLGQFREAVFKRCDQYSEEEKLNKMSRARQQINVVDELILKAKGRLVTAKKDNKTSDMVKSLKRQVQDLEMFKSDLESSGIDSARSNKSDMFEKVLQSEGSEFVIEDILKWRDEALKLRRKYESLLDDNEKLRAESEEEIQTLHQSNKKFINELIELRQEANIADEKIDRANARVQLVEEKLLDERLSHEVEINSLKAMLEKKDETIARLMGKSNPVTPGPEQGQVRLSPEGIVGTSDTGNKFEANDSRSSSPEKEIDEKKGKDKVDPYDDDSNEAFREWINEFKQPETTVSVVDEDGDTVNVSNPQEDESEVYPDGSSGNKDDESAEIKAVLDKIQSSIEQSDAETVKDTSNGELEEEQNVDTTVGIETDTETDSTTRDIKENAPIKKEKPTGNDSKPKRTVKQGKETKSHRSQENEAKTYTPEAETMAQDIVMYEEGTLKEIVYRRNDSEIDGNLSYHKGVGAVLQTCYYNFGVDSVSCEIIDELEIDMLPDFVEGERAVSFQLHFQKKYGHEFTLKEGDSFKLFVPHRHIHEFEEASLIQSVNGGDWEPCDPLDATPSSVDDVPMVCTELTDLTDVKLIAIAREKVECIIGGEADVRHQSKYDPAVSLNMAKTTFKSRTEVKLLVHDTHRRDMLTSIEIHDECKQIMSCTPFVSLLCEQITKEDISVIMKLAVDIDAECKYTMFSLDDYGWTLADCDWLNEEKELKVHLRAGAKKYRVLGLELPKAMSTEEKLQAVKVLHDHTGHYLVRLLFRQREDDPTQAVIICLRSKIVKPGIHELKELGYSMGGYPSSQFCLLEGDTLTMQFSGDITAKPVFSEKMEMTFYPQKEIATKQLTLHLSDDKKDTEGTSQPQGYLSIIRKDDSEKIILGETINFQIDKESETKEK